MGFVFVVVISKTQMRDCYIDEEGFRGDVVVVAEDLPWGLSWVSWTWFCSISIPYAVVY